MASLHASSFLSSTLCSSSSPKGFRQDIHIPHLPRSVPFSAPNLQIEELNGFTHTLIPSENSVTTIQPQSSLSKSTASKATIQLYAILEAVADRVEMHHNIGEQRDNWNTLLLNSINNITLTATTTAGVAATASAGAPLLSLKLASALLFSAATGMLLVMNKIQPSQLAEEQRSATRLFKQLQTHIETTLALRSPTEDDAKDAMDKVLALDKAYPLPLLGAMLDKFPAKFEPAVWWPSTHSLSKFQFREGKTYSQMRKNGWSEGLEVELKEVIEVVKRKDIEDYERLGNLVLKINRTLAIAGPLLTGIAAVGSAFISEGSWLDMIPVVAGALSAAINSFEHGGQVGMLTEMYRNCAGFFQLLENSVEEAIEEDMEKRENGELFEMKLALKLGRSLSQLRDLARKSAYSRVEGAIIDEFGSKLF